MSIDWNGHPKLPLSRRKLRGAIKTVLHETSCYITATYDGRHTPTSWHYRKRAADFGSSGRGEKPEIKAQNLLLRKYGARHFKELFGPDNWYVKDGVLHSGVFPGHSDHLHVAI